MSSDGDCLKCWFSFTVKFWRVGKGWFETFSVLSGVAATILSAAAAATQSSYPLSLYAAIAAGSSSGLMLLRNYADKAIIERREELLAQAA